MCVEASLWTACCCQKHYVDVLTCLVALACASVDPLPLVVDVQINLRKDLHQPLVEAWFDTISGAMLFRKEGLLDIFERHVMSASVEKI